MKRAPARNNRGMTLPEILIGTTAATVLMAGMGASIYLANESLRTDDGAAGKRTTAALAQRDLLADLHLATSFSERTTRSATFAVPDRDGDGKPESLRYAWSGVSGDPLTFSLNGGAPFAVVPDVRSFSLKYLTQNLPATVLPPEQTGAKVLLLVNDSANPTADELAREALIKSWNFSVTMAGTNTDTTTLLSAMNGSAVMYVSSSTDVAAIKFASDANDLSLGIVNEHPQFVDVLGLAGEATSVSDNKINITNNTHYVTSGLTLGNTTITSWVTDMYSLQKTSDDMAIVGQRSDNSPCLATLSAKNLTYDGRTTMGRRVAVPWGASDFDPALLNNTGKLLMCRAIEWASGLGADPVSEQNFGYETVFGTTGSRADHQLAVRAQLPERGTIKSITAYLGGQTDKIRFAIYSDNKGEPDKLKVQSNAANSSTSMKWITLTVPDTVLDAGYYWLAFAHASTSQKYAYTSSYTGAGERNRSNDAANNGFLTNWGTSNASYSGARSIYATYLPTP